MFGFGLGLGRLGGGGPGSSRPPPPVKHGRETSTRRDTTNATSKTLLPSISVAQVHFSEICVFFLLFHVKNAKNAGCDPCLLVMQLLISQRCWLHFVITCNNNCACFLWFPESSNGSRNVIFVQQNIFSKKRFGCEIFPFFPFDEDLHLQLNSLRNFTQLRYRQPLFG